MARILVVDDEPINLKMLKRLLTNEQYEVLEAANGEEALSQTEAGRPDLILLDVMMPGLDGFEVCRRLKSREATRLIPVVMVTALDTLQDKVRGIEAGADDFLTKPYNKIELLARTRSLLKMKALNDELTRAYAHMAEFNDYSDRIFRSFDPANFTLENSLIPVIDQTLRRSEEEIEKPRTIFVAVGAFDQKIKGRVYFRTPEGIRAHPGPVTLATAEVVGIGDHGQDVAFSNWQDLAQSVEEFQEFQPAGLAAKVGPIHNYTAYYSGRVAVVAFNYGKMVGLYDAQALKAMVAHTNFLKTVSDQVNEVEDAFYYTVQALARAAEANDAETGNHIIRVNRYAACLARELNQAERFVQDMEKLAQMHDVGKIHVHPDILRKPGPLNDGEWAEMKRHTVYGAQILGDHSRLELARLITLHHHERWDGTGYPRGLKGEEISLAGRITTLADIYDALRSRRSYKPAFPHDQARRIMLEGDGRTRPEHFDPACVEAFARAHQTFADIWEELRDPEYEG